MVKRINPVPRRADVDHYRDVKAQNDWLHLNVFDSMGNYLYCAKCIRIAFGISKQRLSRQRKMKQSASLEPITQLTKAEVEEKRLVEFVIMPSGCDEAFSTWWKSKSSADIISVRYSHERHGLAGRVSNSAKTETMNDFLDFVDAVNQMGDLQTLIVLLATFFPNSQYKYRKLPFKTMSNAYQHP